MLNVAKIRKEWFIDQIETLKSEGTSYADIASQLGVRPQYLNAIKNAGRGASEKLTLKLCEAFNINYNDLLERISGYEGRIPEIPEMNEPGTPTFPSKKIPLYADSTGEAGEWINVGNLFPDATSAIRYYGDSMPEYPPGSILVLKQMEDSALIVWGMNYYVETVDLGITKRLQDGGKNHVVAYSSNDKTYPDGRLVHEPVRIPKKNIRALSLVLGCVSKEFGKEVMPVMKHEQ